MKLLIASDLHGSALYTDRLIDRFVSEGADRLLLLGDLLYHGPRNALPEGYLPIKTAELLASVKEKIIAVRGNCDSEVDQMVLPFPMMSDTALVCDGALEILATHGHIYNADNMPPMKDGSVLVYGHFHVPMNTAAGGVRVLNPGSVSIPKDGSAHGYMTYENGVFTWKDLSGGVKDLLEL